MRRVHCIALYCNYGYLLWRKKNSCAVASTYAQFFVYPRRSTRLYYAISARTLTCTRYMGPLFFSRAMPTYGILPYSIILPYFLIYLSYRRALCQKVQKHVGMHFHQKTLPQKPMKQATVHTTTHAWTTRT